MIPLESEVPLQLVIPAGILLKHMSEADIENLKAYIRSFSQVYIETEE